MGTQKISDDPKVIAAQAAVEKAKDNLKAKQEALREAQGKTPLEKSKKLARANKKASEKSPGWPKRGLPKGVKQASTQIPKAKKSRKKTSKKQTSKSSEK